MSESISQGIPFLELNESGLRLYKCNDISFSSLKRDGFNCQSSNKKPDQIVAFGSRILIGIEDKADSEDIQKAIDQVKSNYLKVLPNTKYFIVRAGERTKVFFRTVPEQITEIGTTLKGKEVLCFGPADPSIDRQRLVQKINETFLQATNNGTGTLGELDKSADGTSQFQVRHPADYVFTNIPFYVNGVTQIVDSLRDIGIGGFYQSCGIGVESRFLKYILGQIKKGDPGLAFVIVTDGVLYRHKDRSREVINANADVLGIISLPVGCFQNNNWKTSILVFKRKTDQPEYSPVFLYDVENIGISLDAYRTPIEENDIPGLKRAWERRLSGSIDDPKCQLVPRDEFLKTPRWSELFSLCRDVEDDSNISFSEFLELAESTNKEIAEVLTNADRNLSDVFALERYREIELGDKDYFNTRAPGFKTTIRHARLNPGKYPLFSSQVTGPVESMEDPDNPPILIKNETEGRSEELISWNIKGDPCKDIRRHNEPFYATENRGLITIVSDEIDFSYVLYYLREHLVSSGKFSRSNEAHVGKVKGIKIKIPTDDRGNIDLEKQKMIASNYEEIVKLRRKMRDRISTLKELIDSIDVFK